MRKLFSVLIVVLGFAWGLEAQAQVAPTLGFDPYSTFHVGTVDSVNLKNGNIVVQIPVFSLPQLGGFKPMQFTITANTSIWTASPSCGGGPWACSYDIVKSAPLTASFGMDLPLNGYTASTYGSSSGTPTVYTMGTAGEGQSNHSMLFNYSDPYLRELRAVDGSGYRMQFPSGSTPINPFSTVTLPTIYDPNGVHTTSTGWEDTDGNQITSTTSGYTDTIGRSISLVGTAFDTDSEHVAANCPDLGLTDQPLVGYYTWTPVTAPGDSSPDSHFTYKICVALDYYHTNFWGAAGSDGNSWSNPWVYNGDNDPSGGVGGYTWFDENAGYDYVLQSVVLPDGTYWGFGYDSGHYNTTTTAIALSTGLLNKIIQPGGGTISFTYDRYPYMAFTDTNYNQMGTNEYVYLPKVATRTENSGRSSSDSLAVSGTTTYTIAPPGGVWSTTAAATVEAPDHSVTDYVFDASGESSRKTYYDSSRTNLMKEVDSTYVTTTLLVPAIVEQPPMVSAVPTGETTTVDGVTLGTTVKNHGGYYNASVPICTYTGWGVSVGCGAPTFVTVSRNLEDDVESYDGSMNPLQHTTTTWMIDDGTAGSNYLSQNLMNRPQTVTVTDGTNTKTTTYSYDESTYYSGSNIGHATSVSPVSGIATHTYFDASNHGRPNKTKDVKGNETDFTYDSTGLYIESITHANGSVDYFYDYDVDLGKPIRHIDPNGNTTRYEYDFAGRPWSVRNPDTSSPYWSTVACYPDKNTAGVVQAQGTAITRPSSGSTPSATCPSATNAIVSSEGFDGFDRKIITQQVAPEGTIEVDTTYNNMGQVASVTNPYITTPTGYSVSTTYDRLGRAVSVTEQDGSTRTMTPNGLTTTVTDEALNKTVTTTDFLGRTTDVYEPTANNSTSSMLHTQYSYNVYGLWKAEQIGNGSETHRIRRFDYDSIGRLTSVCNPEGLNASYSCDGSHWSMTYTYPVYGSFCAGDLSLPCTKTDSRSVATTYSYDNMNRLMQKTYSDSTPGAYYGYDGYLPLGMTMGTPWTVNAIGRLSHATNGANAASDYHYDAMGHLILKVDCLPVTCNYSDWQSAGYDLAGHVTSLTYPDGLTVNQNFDSAGRLTKVYSGSGSSEVDYLSVPSPSLPTVFAYWPSGAPHTYIYGNGVTETFNQNSRLQTTGITAANSVATLMDRGYSYAPSDAIGSSPACSASSGAHNTGTIWKITDNRNSSWTRQFQYDCLDRLTSANIGSTGYNYWLDSFGNMSPKVSGSQVSHFDPNNRINDLPCHSSGGLTAYDNAGNQLCDTDGSGGNRIYTYDAEERIASIAMGSSPSSPFVSYGYDPEGNRAYKGNAGGTWTDYVRFNGQITSEQDQAGNWTNYIYAGDKKITKVEGRQVRLHLSGVDQHITSGYRASAGLISTRVRTIQSGDVLFYRQYQNNARGGVYINFTNSDEALWDVNDQNGYVTVDNPVQNTWQSRWVALDGSTGGGDHTGETTQSILAINEVNGADGAFDEYIADVAIVNSNTGEVWPIMDETAIGSVYSVPLGNSGAVTSLAAAIEQSTSDPGGGTANTTRYYLDDHLGTAQEELSSGGWPLWYGQFTPYGQEITSQYTNFKYKFTGKERDNESGLDYFGARYYANTLNVNISSTMYHLDSGRWMSPDWSAKPEEIPYSILTDPQSLNLYAYVRNHPVTSVDADGHCCSWDDAKQFGSGFADTTYRPFVQMASHPLDTATAVGHAALHPIDTAIAAKNAVVDTTRAALSGDPNALGKVAGTVFSAVATAGAAKAVSAIAEGAEIGDAARLLKGARDARDALASQVGKKVATVTAGYNTETRAIAAACSGGGVCAEARVVEALGGDPSKVRFTEAVRPRTGAEVPVCTSCESTYGRGAFPEGTKFQNDINKPK